METRWADGQIDHLPSLMSDVVHRNVDVIVTAGTPAAFAAKKATDTIPIVAMFMADPLRTGLVKSLAHPEGNLTGTSMAYGDQFTGKWLELLRESVPGLATVALISNPDNAVFQYLKRDLEAVGPRLKIKIRMIDIRGPEELDSAFKQARDAAQAILLLGDPVTLTYKRRIAELAIAYRIPVMYNHRSFVDEGGLMSYAPETDSQVRRAAEYVDKILRGARPAELPIEQPTEIQLVVNVRTAKAIGIVIPQAILSRADEIIR